MALSGQRKLLIILVALILSAVSLSSGKEATMYVLKNGLQVIFKRNPANKILAMECFIRIGSAYEQAREVGITNFTQTLLLKGTKNRTALQLAEEMESIGGIINTGVAEDYADVTTITTVDDLDKALEIMADVLFNPTFPPEEVEKERQVIIAQIRIKEDSKFYYTYRKFRAMIYEGHPYQFLPDGIPEIIGHISRDQIVEFHKNHYLPANMVLSVVGDVDEEKLLEQISRYFPAQYEEPTLKMLVDKKFKPQTKSEVLYREKEQGFIVFGYLAAKVSEEDYPALKVANAIMGEGMASRLFVSLRDQQGLAYSVGSGFPSKHRTGHIFAWIGTKPESLGAARQGLIQEFQKLAQEQVSPDELSRAKNYLIGTYLLDHQTNIKQAWYLGWFETIGVGFEFDEKYPRLIEQVTAEDVQRVAHQYFDAYTVVTLEPTPPSSEK